jgi:hypothetical protein
MRPHELFPPLPGQARELLEDYQRHLDAVAPLKPKHRRDLRYAVADLSRALASERGGLRSDYLQAARNASAYLRYFLPWNMYRLARLFTGLDSAGLGPDPADGSTILDLGAGPLTVAKALWLARPDLRDRELTFHCVDRSKKVMGTGLALLRAMTSQQGGLRWRVRLVHEPLAKGLGMVRERAALITAGHVLNELAWDRREHLEDQVADLFARMTDKLEPGAGSRILLAERGTRLGGTLLSLARAAALEQGFAAQAPCTHASACPMLDKRVNSWCHFNFAVDDAPEWLHRLTKQAGLAKESAPLSVLLVAPPEDAPHQAETADTLDVRVISDMFPVTPEPLKARYGCAAAGLVLLRGKTGQVRGLQPGQELTGMHICEGERDPKTGAPVIDLGAKHDAGHRSGKDGPRRGPESPNY